MSKSGQGLFRRSVFLMLVLLCIVFLNAGVSALETEGIAAAQQAPLNPDFIRYISEKESATFSIPDAGISGRKGTGLIPSSVYYPQVRDLPISGPLYGTPVMDGATYNVTYDLRTLGKVSPVKDQSFFGTCWAFATMASLESSFMPGSTLDFSEKNLVNTAGFDRAIPDGGGNLFMSIAAFTNWRGPLNEASDRYPLSGQWSASPYFTPVKHVQEVIILPTRTNRSDNANIKKALTSYGAVATGLEWNNSFYNNTNAAYYEPPNNNNPATGHAVTIVGWNDNYPNTNFNTKPAKNGAWIVKNSWGKSWGKNGYFYVSYYDKFIGSTIVSGTYYDTGVFRGEATTNYNGIYSYDKLGQVTSYYWDTPKTGTYANIYTATSAAKIAAVGLYTTDMNASVNIKIYKNPTSGPVTGGILSYNYTTKLANMGYHTIKLPIANYVPVSAGNKFSVVVKVTNPTNSWFIPVEANYPGYTSGIVAYPGQGYAVWGPTGTWYDWRTVVSNSHIALKAYTVAA